LVYVPDSLRHGVVNYGDETVAFLMQASNIADLIQLIKWRNGTPPANNKAERGVRPSSPHERQRASPRAGCCPRNLSALPLEQHG